MDGNSPIGQDKSGKGNDFTPVNFGGSVALDSPAVSGAKPILNTTQGGTQAGVGVFGSKVGAYYAVTVASVGGGNRYHFDGVDRPNPTLIRGATYTFDQSDSTNDNHPLRFSTTSNGSHGGGSEYTDGVVTNGTPGTAGAYTKITVPHNAPDILYYYCTQHSGMGSSTSQITDETKADPYAWKNVLALPLVGSASDLSNQINVGSATKSATASGNAAASREQSNFYDGSFEFDGTTDYIQITDHNDLDTFADFTIEMWWYCTTLNSGEYLLAKGNGYMPYMIYNSGSDVLQFFSSSNGSSWDIASGASFGSSIPMLNKWNHVAVTRSGSAGRLFLNGVQTDTFTSSTTTMGGSDNVTVFADSSGGSAPIGYAQDVRIYKGVAKYTSDFIPAATSPDILPDTPSGVAGGSKLTKITDGAVSFDGTDYLTVADGSNDFTFGTGAYTVEGYLYPTTLTGNGDANPRFFCCGTPSASSNRNQLQIVLTATGQIRLDTNSSTYTSTAGDVVANRWQHIAVARDGSGNLKAFVDGRQVLTQSSVNNNITNNDGISLGIEAGVSSRFTGFMSNVRILKGTALYTSSFTPPAAPLTNITNTKLLCCQSNTSAESAAVGQKAVLLNAPLSSTPFADSSPTGATITNNGSITAVSAGTNSFNITNAASQNGSDQWFTTNNTNISFQGTWTVDIYFKLDSSASGFNALINSGYGTQTTHYMYIGLDDDEKPYIETSSSGSRTTASSALSKNVWYHGRVTQDGSTMTFYVNGISVVTKTAQTTDLSSAGTFTIGSLNNEGAGANSFHGLIGPVRIVDVNIGAPSAGGDATSSGTLSNSFGDVVSVNGDAAATNFNPFITDINAVRGQETGYCTLNPAAMKSSGGSMTNGNLNGSVPADSTHHATFAIPNSGKYYFEAQMTNSATLNFGLAAHRPNGHIYTNPNAIVYSYSGVKNVDAVTDQSYGDSWNKRDIIGCACDADAGTITFYKNGVSQGALTHQIGGLLPSFGNGGTTTEYRVNFGQKPFKFPPPDGFQPLNIDSILPETAITRPDQFVKATLYTGTGANQRIETGMKPDLIWIKSRNHATWHNLTDSVRGLNKSLFPNEADPETTETDIILSTDSTGFSLGADGNADGTNVNNKTYVAWTWRAGGNKGTFNVDDVDLGTAAAAGVSIGGQNSNAYNQTTLWRNSTTTTDIATNIGNDINSVFDGRLDTGTRAASSGQIGILQWASGTIQGKVRVYLSISSDSDITYTANGTTTTVSSVPTGWYDLGTGNIDLTEIKVYYTGSGITFLNAIMVDGKILVDSDVSSPPDLPTIAATGCSIGTKQGFSIIKYTGSGSNGTIAHGLTENPKVVLVKRSVGGNAYWEMFHSSVGKTKVLYLNVDDAATTSSSSWNNREPVSNCFHVGTSSGTNASGSTYVAYCWHDVPGLQKFGSYKGINNANGPFVDLGFRPAVVIIYNTAGSNRWTIQDSTRSTFNPSNTSLGVNISDTELGSAFDLDFLSNGFKVRNTNSGHNADAASFIYLAWAEAPTANLFGAQSNAR
jgi:hypothetical protein